MGWPQTSEQLTVFIGKIMDFAMKLIFKHSSTVEPCLATTPLIRPPRYYGHFILAWKKAQSVISYLKNPFNTANPLIRLDVCGPLVTRLTGPTVD